MKFIQLQEQLVAVDSIVKVDMPRLKDTFWSMRTLLDSSKSAEPVVFSSYTTKDEAMNDYTRIVKQLCADKA